MSMHNAAMLRLDTEVLERLLRLPKEWNVRGVRIASDTYNDALALVIEGPGLPEVSEGQLLPTLRPMCRRNDDGSVFFDWPSTIAAAAE